MDVYTYKMEYCDICNSRACIYQSTIFDSLVEGVCSQSIPPEKHCTFIGCCHGCECSLASSCPPECICDCHKDEIKISEYICDCNKDVIILNDC